MKKVFVRLLVFALSVCLLFGASINVGAENKTTDKDPVITYSYLQLFGEQLKAEILAELLNGDASVGSSYKDISATQGQIIYIQPGTEIIYRGGNAVVITAGKDEGDGIVDISAGIELFSGQSLEFGHIYYPGTADSRKAILVTGSMALFTVRGEYEIG